MQLDFRDEHTVQLNQGPGKEPLLWTFDRVFHGGCSQSDIFDLAAKETAEDVLRGYNGTIFAYGQTGSGKSHTMMGPDILNEQLCGIIPRSCRLIFEHIGKNPDHCEFKVTCSFLEIYKEVIKDLLNPSKGSNLKVRETPTRGVWVEGLSETEVTSHMEVLRLLHQGEEHRAVASTNMNSVSSRSHSLFILIVTQKTRDGAIKIGKLNLADLAGSEKVGKTGASGETLEEAKKINQSLSALGNCIMALTKQKKQHVPYRDSKLTFILRESLGGNTKTTLLIAASPHSFNLEETISTLRFGQRAKAIKNKVKINAQRSVAELELIVKKLTKEVKVLKKYATRLEQELTKLKIDGLDLEAIKRQILEEASVGSQKLDAPSASSQSNNHRESLVKSSSDDGEDRDSEDEDDETKTSATEEALREHHLDGTVSLPSSPKRESALNGFGKAILTTNTGSPATPSMVRSSTVSQLQKSSRGTPTRLGSSRDDMDLTASPMSTTTTPTRPSIFLDGILNDDDTDAMLEAQLEYNRMKENLTLQIQDLTEELVQAAEEKETQQQQHRLQLARAQEENANLKTELARLQAQFDALSPALPTTPSHSSHAPATSSSPTANDVSGSQHDGSFKVPSLQLSPVANSSSPAASSSNASPGTQALNAASAAPRSASPMRARSHSSSHASPRGPITIPLDGSSPLRREASDPVFMTRQMFHWMVLATKLEMFSQGRSMRYDVDFEHMFRELVESNVSTQAWPKKIMKALEAPVAPSPRKEPQSPMK